MINEEQKAANIVNSESTHNFLDTGMTERLGCQIEYINALKVIVANGNVIMHCSKACRELCWSMQGKEFLTDVFFILLENYHMVLRVQ